MCGRYVLYGPRSRYKEYFGPDEWLDFPDRYNIAPSLTVPVIRQSPERQRAVSLLQWGLIPNWSKDSAIGLKLANARAETVAEKPSFRGAFRSRRCIVPASGFYEWKAEGRMKQPYYFHYRSGEPLAIAGLWESWRDPAGNIVRTFCVITTKANDVVAPVHDRMPVLLAPSDFTQWLNPDTKGNDVAGLLVPCRPELMECWPVSKAVSRTTNDGAALIDPVKVATNISE